MAKKNVETLYKNIFNIKESLQDAVSVALETANLAAEFGGEISRVLSAQLKDHLIPAISTYIEDTSTPGSVAPLITFLDSVPLSMTRQEPTADLTQQPAIEGEAPTLPGAAITESYDQDYVDSIDGYTNVNIGVARKDWDTRGARIEKILDRMGVYYDNDGGDNDTYNINAGFDTRAEADKFINHYGRLFDYYDTETFDESSYKGRRKKLADVKKFIEEEQEELTAKDIAEEEDVSEEEAAEALKVANVKDALEEE